VATKIGEVVTEILEYTPGKFYVERYVRPKYVLSKEEKIVIGELPSFPIPMGNVGAGLLAYLLISKFVDHLQSYCQVQQFKRQEIDIAESTISGWFTASCRLLEQLYESLETRVRRSSYLIADEAQIQVQTKDKPGSTHKVYHWVYYSPLDKLVCFDYRKGRGSDDLLIPCYLQDQQYRTTCLVQRRSPKDPGSFYPKTRQIVTLLTGI
jgi:transposase